MTEHLTEEAVRQRSDGTRHIGSVAGRDMELPDHVQRALHGPEPVHRQLGKDGDPPLVVVFMPPVYPGGWKPE